VGDYLVRYEASFQGGKMGLAVVEEDSGRWVKTVADLRQQGMLRFQTSARSLRIILFNNNPNPSQTTMHITRLEVVTVNG
jgi:hypothetical protein